MSEEPSEALRKALNEMEHLRKRSLLVTRLTIYPSVVFLTMSIVTLLFSENKWLGLTWGIISLYALIGAVGVNLSGTSFGNTRRILKTIELLSEGKPKG
jgi:hypothetical protein